MSRTPRTPAFKKKVALEALREGKTLAQIASQHGVHPMQVAQWKKTMLDGAESLFARKGKQHKESEIPQEELERKIGQMTIEIDFLKKNWVADS